MLLIICKNHTTSHLQNEYCYYIIKIVLLATACSVKFMKNFLNYSHHIKFYKGGIEISDHEFKGATVWQHYLNLSRMTTTQEVLIYFFTAF